MKPLLFVGLFNRRPFPRLRSRDGLLGTVVIGIAFAAIEAWDQVPQGAGAATTVMV